MARSKKVIGLGMAHLDEIDGWRGFVASDPGMTFDGVDIIAGENGPEVVSGYGLNSSGERKEYTAAMRATVEAMIDARSEKIATLKSA